MGGVQSRFYWFLIEGDQNEVLAIWHQHYDLQARFSPNARIRESPFGDTPLHCAVRGEMKVLLLHFLENGGDPFTRNDLGDTPLHLACRSARESSRTNRKRAEFLTLLIEWVPALVGVDSYEDLSSDGKTNEKRETSDDLDMFNFGVKNKVGDTPLHVAAASGLLSCVEVLLAHGAPVSVCNNAGENPCDVAAKARQPVIAKLLESKMVLSDDGCDSSPRLEQKKEPLNIKAVREKIITRVANKLLISNFCAQALLMAYAWSEEVVVKEWEQSVEAACEKAGLEVDTVFRKDSIEMSLKMRQCEICFEDIPLSLKLPMPCGHHFCHDCWTSYLQGQILEGGGREIRCPGHSCFKVVSNEMMRKLIPEDQFQRYLHFNMQQFVDAYVGMKWCPFPSCGEAVTPPEGQDGSQSSSSEEGVNVECAKGHSFCWNCLKSPHEPCSCELWRKWMEVIEEMEIVDPRCDKTAAKEAADNAKWIMRNTKPCPQCSAPIQRYQGCNHMMCRKCLHNFCWVCLDDWSKHSSKTGGFFSCNRYKQQKVAEKALKSARKEMAEDYVKSSEEARKLKVKRFEHFYERYCNHLDSLQIESQLLEECNHKAEQLSLMSQALEKNVARVRTQSLRLPSKHPPKVQCQKSVESFLCYIIQMLLVARRILSSSYCLGYFLPIKKEAETQAHEASQSKLEEAVERLSQMVNRPYLNTSQSVMEVATKDVEIICKKYLRITRDLAKSAFMKQEPPPPKPPRHRPYRFL